MLKKLIGGTLIPENNPIDGMAYLNANGNSLKFKVGFQSLISKSRVRKLWSADMYFTYKELGFPCTEHKLCVLSTMYEECVVTNKVGREIPPADSSGGILRMLKKINHWF